MMNEILETYYSNGIKAKVRGRHRSCVVVPAVRVKVTGGFVFRPAKPGQESNGYVRVTSNSSKHGIRYEWFTNYDAAIDAAMKWANRPAPKN